VLAAHTGRNEAPAALGSVESLAGMLERQGSRASYAESEGLWRRLHAHRTAALGEAHGSTLRALRGVVFTTWSQSRREEAAEIQRVLVEAARRGGDPDTRRHEADLSGMERVLAERAIIPAPV
jgi:hypothetical protein